LHRILDGSSLVLSRHTLSLLVQGYLGRRRWTSDADALLSTLADFLPSAERQVV